MQLGGDVSVRGVLKGGGIDRKYTGKNQVMKVSRRGICCGRCHRHRCDIHRGDASLAHANQRLLSYEPPVLIVAIDDGRSRARRASKCRARCSRVIPTDNEIHIAVKVKVICIRRAICDAIDVTGRACITKISLVT